MRLRRSPEERAQLREHRDLLREADQLYRDSGERTPRGNDGLVELGYIAAVFLAPIGAAIGLVLLLLMNDPRGNWVLGISLVVMGVLAILIWG